MLIICHKATMVFYFLFILVYQQLSHIQIITYDMEKDFAKIISFGSTNLIFCWEQSPCKQKKVIQQSRIERR